MTASELKKFKQEVSDPLLKKLAQNIIPEGFLRYIKSIEINELDSRSVGTDLHIRILGFTCENRSVRYGVLYDEWMNNEDAVENLKWLPECVFLTEGTVTVCREMDETKLTTKPCFIDHYAELFPVLKLISGISMKSNLIEFLAKAAKNKEYCEAILKKLRAEMQLMDLELKAGPELHCVSRVTSNGTITFVFFIDDDNRLYCRYLNEKVFGGIRLDTEPHPVRENIQDVRKNDFFLADQCVGIEVHQAWFDAKEEDIPIKKSREYIAASVLTGEVFCADDFRPEHTKTIEKLLKDLLLLKKGGICNG